MPPSDFGGCECDPWAQDCPEGEKCTGYASTGAGYDANKCVVVAEEGEPGDPCTSEGMVSATDSCGETSACFDLAPSPDDEGVWHGTCRAYCRGTPDDPLCSEGEACLYAWEGSVNLCLPSCDPLLQDCEGGQACHYAPSGVFACMAGEPQGTSAKPCDDFDACAPGLVCLDAEVLPSCEGEACCTSYCELEHADPQCEDFPGTSCAPFFGIGDPPASLELLGACFVP